MKKEIIEKRLSDLSGSVVKVSSEIEWATKKTAEELETLERQWRSLDRSCGGRAVSAEELLAFIEVHRRRRRSSSKSNASTSRTVPCCVDESQAVEGGVRVAGEGSRLGGGAVQQMG